MADNCTTCCWFTRNSDGPTPTEGHCQLHRLQLWHPHLFFCRDHQPEATGTGLPQGQASELLAHVVLHHPQYWDMADGEVDVIIGAMDTVRAWTAAEQLAAFTQAEAQAQADHSQRWEEKRRQRVQRIIERRLNRKP
ncbi:MAG: hypothetical protein MUD01_06905 [Chloroflexaceae bacterium]|jgi:uncharacterized damage-inducible protein DinB|nr:hypothetical protein [Chloroflexaceae bacterium]